MISGFLKLPDSQVDQSCGHISIQSTSNIQRATGGEYLSTEGGEVLSLQQ